MKKSFIALCCTLLIGCVFISGQESGGTPRDRAEIHLKLGLQYMKSGQNKVALERLQKAIEIDSEFSQAYNILALLYLRFDEQEKAVEAFESAIEKDPSNASALNNYGRTACMSGDYQKALTLFQQANASALYQTKWLPLTNAGLCALKNQQSDVAENSFRQALTLNPRYSPALLEMVQVQYNKKNYIGARAYLQRYEEVALHTARTLWLAVQTERILGDKNAIASYSLNLRNNFPNTEEARLLSNK